MLKWIDRSDKAFNYWRLYWDDDVIATVIQVNNGTAKAPVYGEWNIRCYQGELMRLKATHPSHMPAAKVKQKAIQVVIGMSRTLLDEACKFHNEMIAEEQQ